MSSYSPSIRHLACMLLILFGLTACDKKVEAPRKPQVVSKKIVVRKVDVPRPLADDTERAEVEHKPADEKASAKPAADKTALPPKTKAPASIGKSGDRAPETNMQRSRPSVEMASRADDPDLKDKAAVSGEMPEKKKTVAQAATDTPPSPAQSIASVSSKSPAPAPSKPLSKTVDNPPPTDPPPVMNPKKSVPAVAADEMVAASGKTGGQATGSVMPADKTDAFGFALVSKSSRLAAARDSGYEYSPVGKIDPFQPLFQAEPVVKSEKLKKKKRILKRRVPQTPLEKVDLSQLKLTGIIVAESGNKALVEEASGKGYVIRKGTYVGIHSGQVVDIDGDRVVVEEEVADILGNLERKKRELKLQKPLGEG